MSDQQTPVDTTALIAALTDIIKRETADAVVDTRKGQAQGIERLDALSNAVLALKNSLQATNQALEKLLAQTAAQSKKSVVYVGKETVPEDLFGNK